MEIKNEIQADVYSKQLQTGNNIFRPLVPEAKDVVRRLMLDNGDKKLAGSMALEVLDRAGETKKTSTEISRPIIIKDSQVQLLVQVAKELL